MTREDLRTRLEREATADLRRIILDLLAADATYEISDRLLCSAVTTFGYRPSRDTMRGLLAWLAEQGLVRCTEIDSGALHLGAMTVARLTERGADVAAGRAAVPGVRRHDPDT